PQQPWHDQSGKAVPAFRLPCKSETKATDHELQKHDIFTRYGHCPVGQLRRYDSAASADRDSFGAIGNPIRPKSARLAGINGEAVDFRRFQGRQGRCFACAKGRPVARTARLDGPLGPIQFFPGMLP
ncbi:hypothetical protein, partial [Bradyrhizobium brasilense]|uniref:hypothetical protein n=1 Tax=Bradyrhizobium brasilense TaxID=1419277 RepID=UPI001AEE52AB